MKFHFKAILSLFLICFISKSGVAQYTDVINSNRPGSSMSSFSVGKRVLQIETGLNYKSYRHDGFNNSQVDAFAVDFAVRYGFFKEQLEVIWDFTYQFDELMNRTVSPELSENRNGFVKNTIGAKYMIYNPISDEDKIINIRSWDANYGFHWKDMIPTVSIYAGANLILGDTPYDYYNMFNLQNVAFYSQLEEPQISPKVVLTTQSNFAGYWVLVTNWSYNRIGTDYPEMGYIVTLTHSFKNNPRLSIFAENQGYKSDIYSDVLVKGGFAYLLGRDFQIDFGLGASFKNTPSQTNVALGVSFRIDRHVDEVKTNKEKSNKDLSKGKKKKKLKKKKKKKSKVKEIEESIEEE
ncbi:transporter [Neptunitalea chrysea]|nr:transporter [Neptunitalea chrysea]